MLGYSVIWLSQNAHAKPTVVASATQGPPSRKASGNIVSASIARMPPAAKASMKLFPASGRLPRKRYPVTHDTVQATVTRVHAIAM